MKTLRFVLSLKNLVSIPAIKMLRDLLSIDKAVTKIESGFKRAQRFALNFFDKARSRAKGFLSTLQRIPGQLINLPNLLAASAVGLTFGSAIGAASFKQSNLKSFEILLKDQAKAAVMFQDAINFAANTPFETTTVIDSYKRLLAARFNPEDIRTVLSGVGDLATIKGFDEQTIDRVITAMAQIKATGKLQGDELNSIGSAIGNNSNNELREPSGLWVWIQYFMNPLTVKPKPSNSVGNTVLSNVFPTLYFMQLSESGV